jgi:hypothetical protein
VKHLHGGVEVNVTLNLITIVVMTPIGIEADVEELGG